MVSGWLLRCLPSPGLDSTSLPLTLIVAVSHSSLVLQFWGRMEDLDEAMIFHHRSPCLNSHSHPHRSTLLSNLTAAISTRSSQAGRMEDLEETVAFLRLEFCPPGDPVRDRSAPLNNLAAAIHTRFERGGCMLIFTSNSTLPTHHITICQRHLVSSRNLPVIPRQV
jgi:hypothetical protein